MSAYDHLAVLAEVELRLVRAGRLEELPDLHARRAHILACLPRQAPEEAREAIERAAAVQAEVVVALAEARDAAGHELARLRQGRDAVRAYGHLGGDRPGGFAA